MAAKKPTSARLTKAETNRVKEMPKPKPKAKVVGSVAKTFDINKLIPKMTPQDAAMLKLLQKKYPDIYPKK